MKRLSTKPDCTPPARSTLLRGHCQSSVRTARPFVLLLCAIACGSGLDGGSTESADTVPRFYEPGMNGALANNAAPSENSSSMGTSPSGSGNEQTAPVGLAPAPGSTPGASGGNGSAQPPPAMQPPA